MAAASTLNPLHLQFTQLSAISSLGEMQFTPDQRAAVCRAGTGTHHVLHADGDLSVAVEGSIETHDVRGIALMQHLQLSDDLVPDGWFDF